MGSEFTKQLGTRRRRAQKTPLVPPVQAGFYFEMGGPRLGLAMLSPEKCRDRAAECLQWAGFGHLIRECEIFSLMWHEPGRGSQSKQRNGGRRTDPKRGLEVLQVHRGS